MINDRTQTWNPRYAEKKSHTGDRESMRGTFDIHTRSYFVWTLNQDLFSRRARYEYHWQDVGLKTSSKTVTKYTGKEEGPRHKKSDQRGFVIRNRVIRKRDYHRPESPELWTWQTANRYQDWVLLGTTPSFDSSTQNRFFYIDTNPLWPFPSRKK